MSELVPLARHPFFWLPSSRRTFSGLYWLSFCVHVASIRRLLGLQNLSKRSLSASKRAPRASRRHQQCFCCWEATKCLTAFDFMSFAPSKICPQNRLDVVAPSVTQRRATVKRKSLTLSLQLSKPMAYLPSKNQELH